MTSHTGRLYAAAAGLLTFFVLWAGIAAHPWHTATADPRLTALAQRQRLLRREAVLVQNDRAAAHRGVRRWQRRRRRRRSRRVSGGDAPAPVRVVTLPPLVVTRTS